MMKIYKFSYLFLILILALNVNAGNFLSVLELPKIKLQNRIHVKLEKNSSYDIDFGGSIGQKLDIYYNKNDIRNLKPVFIYIHGGAWMIGDKYEYSILGSFLMNHGYVTVIPNFPNYPKGQLDVMVGDIHKSILWTYQNISKYGGNKNNIILAGQSSGAHLVALTLFKTALKLPNLNHNLLPLPKLEKVVLLSGPYDFDDFDQATKLITKSESVDHGIAESMVSLLFNTRWVSPVDILKSQSDKSIDNFYTNKFNIYWGSDDTVIPKNSAEKLIKEIYRVSPNTIINYIEKDGQDHNTLISGARNHVQEMENLFLEIVRM